MFLYLLSNRVIFGRQFPKGEFFVNRSTQELSIKGTLESAVEVMQHIKVVLVSIDQSKVIIVEIVGPKELVMVAPD